MLRHQSRMDKFCGHSSPAIGATSTALLVVTEGDNQLRGGASTCLGLPGLVSVEQLTQGKSRMDIPTAASAVRKGRGGRSVEGSQSLA